MYNNESNNDPIQLPFFPHKEQVRSFKRVIPVSLYDFYIVDDIEEPDKYLDLIHTLKSADQQDTVFIYLNTNGGNLYTTVQIMSAMATCQAKVITSIEGQVCSAGTFIFLKGDTKIVNPHCTFMIHNYSQSTSGKGNEIVSQINYMGDYFNRLAADIYKNFLTPEEIKEVTMGQDLWMHSHDVADRLAKNGHEYVYTGDDLDLTVKINTELNVKSDKTYNKKILPKSKKLTRKPTKA